jgi:resuscitation-promoting factor RpfA
MARFTTGAKAGLAAIGTAGALLMAPSAWADPARPAPTPDPGSPAQVQASHPAVAAEADPAAPAQVPASESVPAPATAEVPHLSSPQNLPPGTTDMPSDQGPKVSYLRELWHAYQTQEISRGGALLLLTQRPMDANSSPPAGVSMNPQAPLSPLPPPAPPEPLPPEQRAPE